jgi:putative transposase
MEIVSRCVLHLNVTEHPNAEWAVQRFQELRAFDHPYRFLIHDREFHLFVDAG